MAIAGNCPGASTGGEHVTLAASLELGSTGWLVTYRASSEQQRKMRRFKVAVNDWQAVAKRLKQEAERAKAGQIVCCYETGREGFFPHRAFGSEGIEVKLLGSNSIRSEAGRNKTDKIDGIKLLQILEDVLMGRDRDVREVVVPSEAAEDARQDSRTRDRLLKDRTSLVAQIGSQLVRFGVSLPLAQQKGWEEKLRAVRQWNGQPLPPKAMRHIEMALERLTLVQRQIELLDAEQKAAMVAQEDETVGRRERTRQAGHAWAARASDAEQRLAQDAYRLSRLSGIGTPSAMKLCAEMLSWRSFANRRQVGSYLGFNGIEYSSGAQRRELGISKAGNRHVRSLMVELAWLWRMHQPNSALTLWFERRIGNDRSARARKVAIVALARKLAVALWRYLTHGEIPQGALMKS